MKIKVIHESGYEQALLGISLSYRRISEEDINFLSKMKDVAVVLAKLDSGHNKFLESIYVWLDVTAPRYWWQQADTYRVGCSKQSESTMHTLMKRDLNQDDFQEPINEEYLNYLNKLRQEGEFEILKNSLPEGFLQRRIWCLNYKVIRNIIQQRKKHRLKEWCFFVVCMFSQLKYYEFIADLFEE